MLLLSQKVNRSFSRKLAWWTNLASQVRSIYPGPQSWALSLIAVFVRVGGICESWSAFPALLSLKKLLDSCIKWILQTVVFSIATGEKQGSSKWKLRQTTELDTSACKRFHTETHSSLPSPLSFWRVIRREASKQSASESLAWLPFQVRLTCSYKGKMLSQK